MKIAPQAIDELVAVNENAIRAFSDAMAVSNRILRSLLAKLSEEDDPVEYLNVQECAAFLKIQVHHLYRLTSQHKIPYSKAGRTLRFNKAEIIDWVNKHRILTDDELRGE